MAQAIYTVAITNQQTNSMASRRHIAEFSGSKGHAQTCRSLVATKTRIELDHYNTSKTANHLLNPEPKVLNTNRSPKYPFASGLGTSAGEGGRQQQNHAKLQHYWLQVP